MEKIIIILFTTICGAILGFGFELVFWFALNTEITASMPKLFGAFGFVLGLVGAFGNSKKSPPSTE